MAAGSIKPLDPQAFDFAKAQHLLNRAGFGGTPEQVRQLADMGLNKAVDYLLDYRDLPASPITSRDFKSDIMRPATPEERREARQARRSGDEAALEMFRKQRQERQRADRRQMGEIQQAWMRLMIESPRPLEEKMTLFWHGHFATNYRKIEDSYHMVIQNRLFREHAIGNFKELVHGIIRDPAMLRYLDNNQNRARRPNENLARELMELFTMGEGNDYTEHDIKEAARALTGYTYNDDEFIGLESGQYRRNHDNGNKKIFGRNGNFDGDDLVSMIFNHRVCSEFICLKLYRYFVNDLPDEPTSAAKDYVIGLAREFRKCDYAVKPVLKAMFRSAHFYDNSIIASQIKSPVQFVVQMVRSLLTPSRDMRTLVRSMDLMGQNIFFPPTVEGWAGGRSWINTSTIYVRQNVAFYLLTGRKPDAYRGQREGEAYNALHLVEHLSPDDRTHDLDEVLTFLLRFNLGRVPDDQRVATLKAHVNERGGRLTNTILLEVLSLITAMPEYNLC